MAESSKTHTHTAYVYQRTGKKHGRLLEVDSRRIDADRNIAHVVMNRQPLGGYSGYVQLVPHGVKPAPPPAQPERPDEDGDHSDADA